MRLLRLIPRLELRAENSPGSAAAMLLLTASGCFLPWIGWHLSNLWDRSHYQFFPVLPLALFPIGVARWQEARQAGVDLRLMRLHVPLLIAGIAALSGALWLNSPWAGFLAFVCFLLLVLRNVPQMSAVVLPLLVLLPLPLAYDQDIVHGLQQWSSVGASVLLEMSGIPHVQSGNIVETVDRQFFVAEACSGISSVFLLAASAMVYSAWRRHLSVLRIVTLCLSVFWATAANTFRVFLITWAAVRLDVDLSSGPLHDLLGTTTYLLALLMVVLSEQFFLFLLTPIEGSHGDRSAATPVREDVCGLVSCFNELTDMTAAGALQRFLDRGISGMFLSRALMVQLLTVVFLVGGVANGWIWGRQVLEQCFVSVLDHFRRPL